MLIDFEKKMGKVSTPTLACSVKIIDMYFQVDNSNQSTKLNMESPPEAAIEATPETTPFVTPVKDDTFKFVRPLPSNAISRQLNLDAKLKSPASISSSILSPASSKEPSPLRFPGTVQDHHPFVERRDSIFCGGASLDVKTKTPMSLGEVFTPSAPLTSSTLTPGTVQDQAQGSHSNVSSVAISNSVLLGSLSKQAPHPGVIGATKLRATPVIYRTPNNIFPSAIARAR